MAASFPLSKKTFTQVVDGTTYVEAVLWNTVYDETEAIQTYLGASGNAQSKNSALTNLFRDMLDPVPKITWIDADTIEIEAKTLVMYSGNDYVIKRNSSALQITLSANLDTGAEANSTWYYVWLVGDGASTTYTAVFSLSASAPDGVTYGKLIGRMYNDGSGDISSTQKSSVPNNPVQGWINFDGTGTIAIKDSYNVDAIVDNGVGDYTITWDIDFANAFYSWSGGYAEGSFVSLDTGGAAAKTAGDIDIITQNNAGTRTDADSVSITAIGNQ